MGFRLILRVFEVLPVLGFMLVGTNIITTIYSCLIAAGFSRGSLHFLLIVANVASNVAVIMVSCVKSAVAVVVGVVGTIVIFYRGHYKSLCVSSL